MLYFYLKLLKINGLDNMDDITHLINHSLKTEKNIYKGLIDSQLS